jgi:hypothetical protein
MTKIKDKPASRPQWAERDPHARTGACLELWTDGRTFHGAHAEQPEILNGMGLSSGPRCSVKDEASQQIAVGVSGPGTRLFHVRVTKNKNASYWFTDLAISRCPSKRDISRTKMDLPTSSSACLIIKYRHPTNKISIYISC